VTDEQTDPHQDVPSGAPGERRLDRPPSDRYRATAATGSPAADLPMAPSAPAPGADDRRSPARGIAFGTLAAVVGAVVLALLGGALAVTAGLLVVAAAIGYVVGLVTVVGAADTMSRRARPWIAATLAGLGTLLGQVGLWLIARAEGGVLAPMDYLGQTFGPLVPAELLLAVGVAWWRAR
jgi:hypothetical protein